MARTLWALAIVATAVTMLSSCAQSIARQGVVLNQLGVTKEHVGPSNAGVATEGYVSRKSAARFKHADVTDGPEVETLKQLEGLRGVEVFDSSGRLLTTLETKHYLTDFGAIHASRADKLDVVLYVYPSTPDRGGTFSVVSLPSRTTVATWDIHPATDRFAVGRWKDQEALFYLQEDALVVRSPFGEELERLDVPGGRAFFRVVQVMTIAGGQTVVLASGDGYTRYHMVSVFDAQGQLTFHEIDKENAYRLESPETDASSDSWTVSTRSSRWRYRVAPR